MSDYDQTQIQTISQTQTLSHSSYQTEPTDHKLTEIFKAFVTSGSKC